MSSNPTPQATHLKLRARRMAAALVTMSLLLFAGCASMPTPMPRTPSQALPPATDTALARLTADSTPPELEHLSGFALIADGSDALATRLALVRLARKTLDVQVYLIGSDTAGVLFLRALHEAAERGVRVRLRTSIACASSTRSCRRTAARCAPRTSPCARSCRTRIS
jgi:putative cardiolipin synthase